MNVNYAAETEQRRKRNPKGEQYHAHATSSPIINLKVASGDFQVIVGDKTEHCLGTSPIRKEAEGRHSY